MRTQAMPRAQRVTESDSPLNGPLPNRHQRRATASQSRSQDKRARRTIAALPVGQTARLRFQAEGQEYEVEVFKKEDGSVSLNENPKAHPSEPVLGPEVSRILSQDVDAPLPSFLDIHEELRELGAA